MQHNFALQKSTIYTMTRIPRTKEWLVGYKTLFTTVMEPHEAFTSTTMKRPSVQTRLPLKIEPLEVEPEGWGDNALRVSPVDLQQK
jgi:hypothetical protein